MSKKEMLMKAKEEIFREFSNKCAALDIKLPQHQAIQNGIQGIFNALMALENPKEEEPAPVAPMKRKAKEAKVEEAKEEAK